MVIDPMCRNTLRTQCCHHFYGRFFINKFSHEAQHECFIQSIIQVSFTWLSQASTYTSVSYNVVSHKLYMSVSPERPCLEYHQRNHHTYNDVIFYSWVLWEKHR